MSYVGVIYLYEVEVWLLFKDILLRTEMQLCVTPYYIAPTLIGHFICLPCGGHRYF